MKKADYFAPRMPPGYVWSFDPEAQKLTFTCDLNHTRTVSTSQVVNRFSVCRAQNIPFCADCNKLSRIQASQEEWQNFLIKFWKDSEEFANLVEKLPEEKLAEAFVNEKYGSYQRNIDGMIEHCYYHLAQIVLIKKILDK